MKDKMQILHLEDNAMDAELIHEYLERAGIPCDVTRVESEHGFSGALSKGHFDLIISDFSMPEYSGGNALKYAHQNYPDVPFIFVSGTVGEDYAIECLLNGATDYVLKNKMSRLVPAVKRALDESSERKKRREAEQALAESNRRFRALVEDSVDGITVFGDDGQVVYRSPQNPVILGQAKYLSSGGEAFANVHPDDLPALNSEVQQLTQRKIGKFAATFRYKHGDGSWRWLDARFSDLRSEPAVRGIVCNFIDVTEKREAELQLRQSQKMESLGTLSGGIAHDFNNILAIITGYASLLKRRQIDEEKFAQCVSAIQSAADRGVGLVRQLLMFSRKQESEFVPLNINTIVEEVYKLISETFPKVISSTLALGDIPITVADHVQVNQCILNLCVNARDAMMDRNDGKPSGGRMTISTRLIQKPSRSSKENRFAASKYIAVSVSDTGVGMDGATRAKIFEPFFTTKGEGKGTGIGLSTVFGVMKKHGGDIEVETKPGAGTTFTLLFPVAPERKNSTEKANEDEQPIAAGGTERIFIVEDEETLRDLLREVLEEKGYLVETAGDGKEALSMLSRKSDYALVICDLGLPELDGIDVLTRIKQTGLAMKTVIASGFIDPEESKKIEKLKIDGVIQKPYNPDNVVKKIRQILDRR